MLALGAVKCPRLRPCASVALKRRKLGQCRAVPDVPHDPVVEIPDDIEMKEVIDASLEHVDRAVYTSLKKVTPKMLPFTRTFITIGITCSLIIAVFQALAYVARLFHNRIVRHERGYSEEKMDNTMDATTATVLKPLAVTLPILGWLIAMQRGFTGLETLFHVCTKQPAWFKSGLVSWIHHFVDWAAPLRCHLANAAGAVIMISITWTLLLLKRRFFNSMVDRVGKEAAEAGEEEALENMQEMRRAMLPVNTLLSWVIIGFGVLLSLKLVGLDPSPLLAVGSVSGIVVGFASQQLVLNLIAGISIFLTRPFVVGDVVTVKLNHLLIASGTIANISPLRTTFLDENSQPVTLPNKLISDAIITRVGERTTTAKQPAEKISSQMKQILVHDFTLKRPSTYVEGEAYDEYAKRVIKALTVKLFVLPHTQQGTMKAYVSGLSASGEITIRVSGIGLPNAHALAENIRQNFLLSIHSVLCKAELDAAKENVEDTEPVANGAQT